VKVAFVDALSASGVPFIEVTSFVNPRAVPQLADAAEVMVTIERRPGTRYPVLVPNERGMERAVAAGVQDIAVFTAATENFAQANVGTTIDGTFERFAAVISRAKELDIAVRGYVSVAFGCPYAGDVSPEQAVRVALRLLEAECEDVCFADTIGVATPVSVAAVLDLARDSLPAALTSLHFHDTHGRALDNVSAGLEKGVRRFDAAAGGLGGCPFAPGASGNLDTGQLLNRLAHLGMETGVDADRVREAVDLLRSYVPRLQTAIL
jgi:isopropylmalate/homocitrate/citramalate synthase